MSEQHNESVADLHRALCVLITGGSRGIGRAVSLAFAAEGARIAMFFKERHDAAHETVKMIASFGGEAAAYQVDVIDRHAVHETVDELTEGGFQIDVLVNAAGITRDRTLHKLPPADWDLVIATNLTGTYNCCRAVIHGMRERNFGRIVNVSSIVGQTGGVGQTNYAATKAGVIGFTKSLALETAQYDITVNAVCPGFIETDMLAAVPEASRQRILERIPKGRFGTADEIARVVTFLARGNTGFITGQQINVNGGMYL